MRQARSIQHLMGVRFHKLVIIEDLGNDARHNRIVKIKCDCGIEKEVNLAYIKKGYTKSCGCERWKQYNDMRKERAKEKASEHIGKKYNRLLVTGVSVVMYKKKTAVCAICDCGKEGTYPLYYLINGKTKSCGCFQKDVVKQLFTKHGFSDKHSLYNVWCGMINRCEKPFSEHYKHYGGRGVTVCKEWRDDFISFYNWAIDKWKEGLQLDKDILSPVKPGMIYGPEFCSFVSSKENVRNRVTNVYLSYNGETMCMSAWSEKLGIPYHLISRRHRKGWPIEQIFRTELYKKVA